MIIKYQKRLRLIGPGQNWMIICDTDNRHERRKLLDEVVEYLGIPYTSRTLIIPPDKIPEVKKAMAERYGLKEGER